MTPDELEAKFRSDIKPWFSRAVDSLHRFQARMVYYMGGETVGTLMFWYMLGTSAIGTGLLIWWVL